MCQVPRYIITLHELLAHTPHDHVERKSLENARRQLEDLSRQMHDEVCKNKTGTTFISRVGATRLFLFQVSETENLRKNLAVERMIVEGCDILLDVNQVFVRQGESNRICMQTAAGNFSLTRATSLNATLNAELEFLFAGFEFCVLWGGGRDEALPLFSLRAQSSFIKMSV